MDPLSDLLRVVRLDGAYFYAVEAAEPWSVRTLPARELTPPILPAAEHLISYHIILAGHCWAGLADAGPAGRVELAAGDVIVFPHGDAHELASARELRTGPGVFSTVPDRYPNVVLLGRGEPRATRFFCGFLGCDRRPFNPLLAALPRRLHLRGLSDDAFGGLTHRLAADSGRGRAGADVALTRLAETMFVEVLRRWLAELPAGETGWLAGLRDEVVGRALALLHARPGHPWTVAALAREAAASRTNLALRFMDVVGQPPMQYLARWRMQVAGSRLLQGAKVAAVAAEVGYESEAAFSRAFKRATGVGPGAWRKVRASGTPGQEVGTGGHWPPPPPPAL